MAEKIKMGSNGILEVPDEPIIPFIEGDGTGIAVSYTHLRAHET